MGGNTIRRNSEPGMGEPWQLVVHANLISSRSPEEDAHPSPHPTEQGFVPAAPATWPLSTPLQVDFVAPVYNKAATELAWSNSSMPERFIWVVGWCTPVQSVPRLYSPCATREGAGYVQRMSDGACHDDFVHFRGMAADGRGIKFRYEAEPNGGVTARMASIPLPIKNQGSSSWMLF